MNLEVVRNLEDLEIYFISWIVVKMNMEKCSMLLLPLTKKKKIFVCAKGVFMADEL